MAAKEELPGLLANPMQVHLQEKEAPEGALDFLMLRVILRLRVRPAWERRISTMTPCATMQLV